MNTFEDRLLTELKAVVAERAGQPQPARADKLGRIAGRPAFHPGAAGPRWRPRAVVAGVAAASMALAGGVTGTVLALGHQPRPASQYSLVADFLNQAATAARAQAVGKPGIRGDYFIVSYDTGMVRVGEGLRQTDTSCEVAWYSSGRPLEFVVWSVKPADKQCHGVSLTAPGKQFKPTAPHWYPPPGSLSDQPAEVLAQLRVAAEKGAAYWSLTSYSEPGPTRDQIVFSLIERLLQTPLRGDLRAALYQATIALPGVKLDPHAVTALGHHGTGVSMQIPNRFGPDIISEFILAPSPTFNFLGTRTLVPGLPPIATALVMSGLAISNSRS